MKINKLLLISFLFLSYSTFTLAQKVTISGKILEKTTNVPLEYATVILQNTKDTSILAGGVTDLDGNFKFEVAKGTYNIRYEYISFKTVSVANKVINANLNLGTVFLEEDATVMETIELVAEKSTVEFKLDKRVYNVGSDMIVKGGTASDVLDNVPSVTVDTDGTVALRGNENVRILIDGRPSGLAGINIQTALRTLPADAIEKVEVITNPSARYDAEGGGGIINIVLRKGKTGGLNGSVTATTGNPENYGLNSNLNYRSDHFNLFSNFGYNYRTSPGNSLNNSEYFDANGATTGFIYESRKNERLNKSFNGNFGIDLFLNETTNWSNSLNFNRESGNNPDNVFFNNYDANFNPTFTRNRFSDEKSKQYNLEYSSNFTKRFKKEDHKLTIDVAISQNKDNEASKITDQILGDPTTLFVDNTNNIQKQQRNLFQTDYVLPLGANGRLEAGYRGSFQNNLTQFTIDTNAELSNDLEYVENVNALYTQYGNKINKFSYFLGLRWEDSHIEVNSLTDNDFNTKKYNNFFPTATLNYDIDDKSNVNLSYSKRINRPRGRFLNPTSSFSSNINIFQGNPDLDPTYTNAFEIGYLKRWDKITLNSSAYANFTDEAFQFIRRESGLFVDGIPVILSTPINLSKETRMGFEFNANYSPYKWWRLNGNFNFFRNVNEGDYTYVNYLGNTVTQNFDVTASSWFTRISSKINLPYKVDFQTNVTYNAPQKSAQGKRLDITSINLAFSKDVLKEKGTVTLNVSDLLNSRKRRFTNQIENVISSYSEFQWRVRQVNVSFTYRFNKKKERESQRGNDGGGPEEFMGRP
ncbi:TonB-dependent receptor domain-containing protein [Flavobacterium sp.]|uniref:TonB-dependent receptor domain-containing protein n=1 Tax=Flavobacterium sp. TaxID=239 RepID=UPI003F6A1B61